ncbi:hypothetical protein DSM104443_01022 [Usitatibacter rugosus]|uniref:Transmembrane protein n=1 Tax=Usitatibacter rugosus TaxID=2732067 RepID=A0A6M4GRT8_9PROT|nr:hypothetical protein [Usitatibacter rugosus]QJR09971.1 hypothetical protein DSM104443_01022 [Usitatibacter rugosus]
MSDIHTDPTVIAAEAPNTGPIHILYLLHGLAPFTAWILAVVAVFVGAVKRDDYRGSWLDTHISWLSRTFWWGLLWIVIASVVTFLMVLTLILAILAWIPFTVLFVWYLYRVIRGWLLLNDKKPAPA